MKHLLLTTIAAVLLVGCGNPEANYSGNYTLDIESKSNSLELKPDGSFIGTREGSLNNKIIGSWKVEEDLLVCEGITEKSSEKIGIKFNKTTLKVISLSADGSVAPSDKMIPEGADGLYLKKN